jgi:hypothetical protein
MFNIEKEKIMEKQNTALTLMRELDKEKEKWSKSTFDLKLSAYEANKEKIHFIQNILSDNAVDLFRRIESITALLNQVESESKSLSELLVNVDPSVEGYVYVMSSIIENQKDLLKNFNAVLSKYLVETNRQIKEMQGESE